MNRPACVALQHVRFARVLHVGPYATEPATVERMRAFAAEHGIAPVVERHPLESVNEVMGKLRAGKVVFRAVLVP